MRTEALPIQLPCLKRRILNQLLRPLACDDAFGLWVKDVPEALLLQDEGVLLFCIVLALNVEINNNIPHSFKGIGSGLNSSLVAGLLEGIVKLWCLRIRCDTLFLVNVGNKVLRWQ